MNFNTTKMGKITRENFEKDLEYVRTEGKEQKLPQFYIEKLENIIYSAYTNIHKKDMLLIFNRGMNEVYSRVNKYPDEKINVSKCNKILNTIYSNYKSRIVPYKKREV